MFTSSMGTFEFEQLSARFGAQDDDDSIARSSGEEEIESSTDDSDDVDHL